MESKRPKKRFMKDASIIFMKQFGSLNLGVILCIVLLLMSLDWMSSAINDIITRRGNGGVGITPWDTIRIVSFPILLVVFWCRARGVTSRRVHSHIKEHVYPRPVNVLIMFLSTKGKDRDGKGGSKWKDEELIERLIEKGGSIDDEELRNEFKGSWRMPIEAIAHHAKRLDKVVVIPSEDSEPQLGQFRSLVQALTREHTAADGITRQVLSPPDMGDLPPYVDFENAIQQNEVLNAVLDSLMENHGVPADEIMIDVTGGQKVCSVIGTVVSLSKDWSIQYVSTNGYRIKEYSFTVETTDVGR